MAVETTVERGLGPLRVAVGVVAAPAPETVLSETPGGRAGVCGAEDVP